MVALIVMALSPWYWLAFVVLFVGGFGTAGFGNMQTTLMLTEAPPDMRSRLMGVVTVCIGTARSACSRPACCPRDRPARRDPGDGDPRTAGDGRAGRGAAAQAATTTGLAHGRVTVR